MYITVLHVHVCVQAITIYLVSFAFYPCVQHSNMKNFYINCPLSYLSQFLILLIALVQVSSNAIHMYKQQKRLRSTPAEDRLFIHVNVACSQLHERKMHIWELCLQTLYMYILSLKKLSYVSVLVRLKPQHTFPVQRDSVTSYPHIHIW